MKKLLKCILFLVPFMLLSGLASAADTAAQAAEIAKVSAPASGLLKLFQTNAAEWGPRLTQYATYLLFSLGLMQLVWTFSLKALDGNLELGGIIADLIRFIMVMGFFMAMIEYFPSWGGKVVDSFRKAAGVATGLGKDVTPSEMFWVAVSFAWRIVKEISAFGFGTAVITAIMAVIVLLCFTFISCFMLATLVESFIVINAAVLFMGFGGSSWTREFAIAPLKYLISVGAKLFVLTLVVGIIIKSSNDWLKAYNGDMTSLMTLGGMAFICAYMTKTIPELVAGMISGASSLGNISSAPSNDFEGTPQQEENGRDAASENSNIIRPAQPATEK